MTSVQIKSIKIEDIETLQRISRTTFYETFSSQNTEENMQNYLNHNLSLEQLSREIKNPDSHFYIAYLGNENIAYLKINFNDAQTESTGDHSMEIERIYVLEKYQSQGIGQLLFEKAVHIAHQKQIDYIWLGVWEKNEKAIQFYKKNGFTEFSQHVFKLGDDEQIDLMMRKKI